MKKQNTLNITKITDKNLLKEGLEVKQFGFTKYCRRDFIIWNSKTIFNSIEFSTHSSKLVKDICRKFINNLKNNNMQLNEIQFHIDVSDIIKSYKHIFEDDFEIQRNIYKIFMHGSGSFYKELNILSSIINLLTNEEFKSVIIPETNSSEEWFLIIEDDCDLKYRDIELIKNVFSKTISLYNVEYNNRTANFTKEFQFYSSYDCSDVESSMNLMTELIYFLQQGHNISIDNILNSEITLETED